MLLAACAHRAPPAPPPPPPPPPAPTAGLAAYLEASGAVDTSEGHFTLTLVHADACTVVLRWNAAMSDGGTLRYDTTLDLGSTREVSVYEENTRWCIELAVASAHAVIHMTSPTSAPLDRTLDESSWGICAEHDYVDRLVAALRDAAHRCGAAL